MFVIVKSFLIKQSKMRHVEVDVVGDIGYCVPDGEIDTAIEEFTSESDGVVQVLIILGPFTPDTLSVAVSWEGEIGLVVFRRNFIAIFHEDALNVRYLIYVIDNPPIHVDDFLRNVSNNEY